MSDDDILMVCLILFLLVFIGAYIAIEGGNNGKN